MKTTHTPGPWEVDYDAIVCMGGQVIGQCAPDRASFGEKLANARLIAAAPDLLAALEAITKWGEAAGFGNSNRSKQWSMFEAARAAIAKAKGE